MARYSVAGTKTTTATANLPIVTLHTPASKDARIWEIGVFIEPTAAANIVELRRQTAAGAGAATSVVPVAEDASSAAAVCTADTAYATTQPAATGVALRRINLPATVGAGVIWTFPSGIVVPVGSAQPSSQGLVLLQVSATITTYGWYITYEE